MSLQAGDFSYATDGPPPNGAWMPDVSGISNVTGLFVEFYRNTRKDKDYIKIAAPANPRTVINVPATDEYKEQYPLHWEAYKNEMDQFAGEIRLEEVNFIDPGSVTDLKNQNVHTVEQLAAVSDDAASRSKIMGLWDYRDKARDHLAVQARAAGYDELKAEYDQLRARMEVLEKAKSRAPKKTE